MSSRFFNISLQDSILIKGWAILIIVLHNFFHSIYKVTKENEMDFDPERFVSLTTQTLSNPSEWVHGVFTFFGHFGVQLFIFVSAYGMTMANAGASAEKGLFLRSRVKKIYPTFLLAAGLWLVLVTASELLMHDRSLANELDRLLFRLNDVFKVTVGVHNLLPYHAYPKVGPWWFIPFIMQFYLLWAMLSNKLVNLSKGAMFAVALAGIAFNYIAIPWVNNTLEINLLYSPLGHIPEIMLGVYWARFGVTLRGGLIMGALAVFVLSSLYQFLWPLHHITGLLLLLWMAFALLTRCSHFTNRTLYILGLYSLPLFLVNGFLRPPFKYLSRHYDAWYVDILASIVLVFLALGVAMLIYRIEKRLMKRFDEHYLPDLSVRQKNRPAP